jgi:hypothetical protein
VFLPKMPMKGEEALIDLSSGEFTFGVLRLNRRKKSSSRENLIRAKFTNIQ